VRLRCLALVDFRNYAELRFDPQAGLNLLVGPNAQGKSNLLEAIGLLGTGKSFRTHREADAIREGRTQARVMGLAHVAAGTVDLACTIARGEHGTRKSYTVNGRDVRYASYLGRLAVVTFVPADLQLASGAPALRRAFLNAGLSQIEPGYYHELARYHKTLQQKNALLRAQDQPDPDLLAVYDRTLLEAGTTIILARTRFVNALAEAASSAHARIGGGEHLDMRYHPNVAYEEASSEGVRAAFEARLGSVAARERARKAAIAGPHRDDLQFSLGGHPLGSFGSQGQQRTAVLALKVAEYAVMHARTGEAPLLLLDDVLSELDGERASAFLEGIGGYEQAFVTATHVPAGLPPGAHLYAIERGRVLMEAS
jgi:DNA replication and repair protein RecF